MLVGKKGLTDSFVKSVADVLDAHELVKLRFNEFKDDKKAFLAEVTLRTGADLVGVVGHVATLYKRQPDDERRVIELPR